MNYVDSILGRYVFAKVHIKISWLPLCIPVFCFEATGEYLVLDGAHFLAKGPWLFNFEDMFISESTQNMLLLSLSHQSKQVSKICRKVPHNNGC